MKNQKKAELKTLERPSIGCCPTASVAGVKQIDVSGLKIGIRGLDEIFQTYLDAKIKPEEVDGDKLVTELGKLNYIADGSEGIYKEAFLRDYCRYYEGKRQSK